MIYLTTGTNGSGKTLLTLKDVRDLQVSSGRPVFYNGRFKLTAEKEAEFGWVKFDFRDWESLPDGSICLVDECHNDLPLRPSTQPPPSHIAAIAEHRLRGFDFYLITQHPQNIDVFVRRLVGAPGYHRHLKRISGSQLTNVCRWDFVNPNCEKPGSSANGEASVKGFPKEVFGWYESAVMHTGKVRIPRQVYILVACIVFAVLCIGYVFYKMKGTTDNAAHAVTAMSGAPAKPGPAGGSPADAHSVSQNLDPASQYSLDKKRYLMGRSPFIPALPHTAPAYVDVTKPVRSPYPAACISDNKRCKCYTTQGTVINVEDAVCRDIVKTGFFVDFDERPQGDVRDVRAVAGAPVSAAPSDGVLGASKPLVGGQAKPAGGQQPAQYVSVSARAE